MTRRAAAGLVAAAAWGAAAWLLWRTSVPSLHLGGLDPHRLFTAAQLHRARRYSSVARLLWLGSVLAKLGALAAFARFGTRWARESAAGPIGTGMLLGMLAVAVAWAAQLPFAVLASWWRGHNGLGHDYVQATVGDWLALGGRFVILCLVLAVVMGFARRVGDSWWLASAPVVVGLVALSAFVSPWLLGGRTYHGDVRSLERIEGVHVPVKVLDNVKEPNAFATGLGPSRRVFLWEPILEPPFTPREDRFVLAHELGHLKHDHIWRSIGWYALFALPAAFLVARVTRRRGGLADPTVVPFAVLVFALVQLAALPLQNLTTRRMEAEADWTALRATHDPQAGRQLFKTFASETLEDPDPPTWDYVLLQNHPTLMQRLAMVDRYATSAAQSP